MRAHEKSFPASAILRHRLGPGLSDKLFAKARRDLRPLMPGGSPGDRNAKGAPVGRAFWVMVGDNGFEPLTSSM